LRKRKYVLLEKGNDMVRIIKYLLTPTIFFIFSCNDVQDLIQITQTAKTIYDYNIAKDEKISNPLSLPYFTEFCDYLVDEFSPNYLGEIIPLKKKEKLVINYYEQVDTGTKFLEKEQSIEINNKGSIGSVEGYGNYLTYIENANAVFLFKYLYADNPRPKSNIIRGITIRPEASSLCYNFISNKLFYDFNDMNDFFFNDKLYNVKPPTRFLSKKEEIKNDFNELSTIFQKKLNGNYKEFFKRYKKKVLVGTTKSFDYNNYYRLRSQAIDVSTSAVLSAKTYGEYEEREFERHALINFSKEIRPSWSEIKEFFGGLEGVMKRNISKDSPVFLRFEVNRIELQYDEISKKINASLFIDTNASDLGEEYYSNYLKNIGFNTKNSTLKVIGEAKFIGNFLHHSSIVSEKKRLEFLRRNSKAITDVYVRPRDMVMETQPIFLECEFPDNLTGKSTYKFQFNSIQDSRKELENLLQVKKLFTDEVESIIKKVPFTTYLKEQNKVLVYFSSSK